MATDFGFHVLRQVPQEFTSAIKQGIYTLHGGVIREAVNGRIVAHLAMPNLASTLAQAVGSIPVVGGVLDAVQIYQLSALSQKVQQVLSLSLASTTLSGLGLATSLVGFVLLDRRMKAIDGQIAQVKSWLSSASEGQLRAAVSDLSHAARAGDLETRRHLILSAKSTFTSLSHHYREQAAATKSLREFELREELCMTAMLGSVMCTSHLGLLAPATEDMKAFHRDWSIMARRQLKQMLDLDNAARLLDGRYAKALPASELIALLDFANDKPQGILWIDELRQNFGRAAMLSSGFRPVGDDAIRSAIRLRARSDVLESYCAHFDYLQQHGLDLGAFERLVADATSTGRMAVLVPAPPAEERAA